MRKVHRDGIDVGIAFASASKRASYRATQEADCTVSPVHGRRRIGLFRRIKELKQIVGGAADRLRNDLFRYVSRRQKPRLENLLQELRELTLSSDRFHQVILTQVDNQEARLDRCEHLLQDLLTQTAEQTTRPRHQTARLDQHEHLLQDLLAQTADQTTRLGRIEEYSLAAARRFAVGCGPNDVLVRTEVGFILCSASDHSTLAALSDTGDLEPGTRLLIQRFLAPGDFFVDVGANLGMHTIAAARAMKGRGKILAFEPFEETESLLEKSVWMNGFSEMVEIHRAAVSNNAGLQKLFLGKTCGHHSLLPVSSSDLEQSKFVEVPTVRLDDAVRKDEQVSLLKIDVEGAELAVLEGAQNTIRRTPDVALIVEFGPTHLSRAKHSAAEWLSAFAALGLVYRAINEATGELQEMSQHELENATSTNLFLSRPDSKAWAKAVLCT